MRTELDNMPQPQPTSPMDANRPVIKAAWSKPTIDRISIKRTMLSGGSGVDLNGKANSASSI